MIINDKDEYPLREAIVDYFENRARCLSLNTQKKYQSVLLRLERFMNNVWEENAQCKTLGNISESAMLHFLGENCGNENRSDKTSRNTYNTLLGVSSAFFTYFKHMGVLESAPTDNIPRKQPIKSNTRFLTRSEQLAVLKQAFKNKNGLRDYLIILLALNGLRLSELAQLKIGDLDFENETVNINLGFSNWKLPLHSDVLSALKNYINNARITSSGMVDPSSPLFTNTNGQLSLASIETIVLNVFSTCGLDKGGMSLRKTYAYNLLDSEVNIISIMHLLGHKNINTTVKCLKIENSEALEKLRVNYPKAFKALSELPDPIF